MHKSFHCARKGPGRATLGMERRNERGVSAQWRQTVLGAPGRTRAAHIVQFGAVGTDRVAGHLTPEIHENTAERDEGTGQQRICGTRYSQYGATHDTSPTSTADEFVRLFLGRPDRRPGSWSRMMSSKRLKTRARRDRERHFHNQAFQKFTDTPTQRALWRLLFRCSTATSAPHFPEKTASKTR